MTWTQDIPGRALFYPCAGRDFDQFLDAFGDHVDEFIFVDLHYQFGNPQPISHPRWKLLPGGSVLTGPPQDSDRVLITGAVQWRDVDPAWLREKYHDANSGRTIRITRRRGFGQYALDELPDASLGIFCHRGDSLGEGGSNAYFLANKNASHPPLANLFDKIKRKLNYPALIVTDGSNTRIRDLRVAASSSSRHTTGYAFQTEFVHFDLRWQYLGALGKESGTRTIVWQVDHV